MSIRTTVTLDEDVLERVRQESRNRGASFKDTLNDLLRIALVSQENKPARRTFKIPTFQNGALNPDLDYDCTGRLLEYLEGPWHK